MTTRAKKLTLALGLAGAGVLMTGAYIVFAPRTVPEGQRELVKLDAAGLPALRDDFNAAGGGTRLLVLLSPT